MSYVPNMLLAGGLEAKNRLGWRLKDCPTPSILAQGSPAPPMAIGAGGWEKKKGYGRCNLPHSVDVFRVRCHVHGKVRWQLVAWAEGKVARLEHVGGTFSDDRLSQNMEASDHGIGFPTPQKLDCVGIDIGTEEGGSPTSTQGPGTDFFCGNVELDSVGEYQMDPGPQYGGHILGSDMMGLGRVS